MKDKTRQMWNKCVINSFHALLINNVAILNCHSGLSKFFRASNLKFWLQGAFVMMLMSMQYHFFFSAHSSSWIYINNILLLKSCVTKCKYGHRMHNQCFRQPMSMMIYSEQVGRWPIKMSMSCFFGLIWLSNDILIITNRKQNCTLSPTWYLEKQVQVT